ncbi:putative glycosyltransferase [Heterostelium album PN500]|uniref:UDP-N-acetylglucosamine transferase subunit ALG14 n=1 Tax=Heterostelium pallidum (strain ATCC 26659 / Pp 5 / PN500) TaxID=670386 RepID=D3B9X1_HETP5|nr:putative glycosyltransferase [Heterostelium album PN500]EFA81358.1 putative glycosyltransferase [Heterostelium album PN500]|eukprot:XP_020433476.1 putative glycosyltransferase [Heterostelium album PN500]
MSNNSNSFLNEKKYVFVTVGTTRFEELIQEVDKKEFHQLLKSFGYNAILMQIGNSGYIPVNSVNLEDQQQQQQQPTTSSSSSLPTGFQSYYYRFKPSLFDDMNNSTLIISHGGSGSILESLEIHKPIVCVTNSRLMHNHQVELADRLSGSPYNYLLPCEPSNLASVIKDDLKSYLATRQQMNDKTIDRSLNRFSQGLKENTESLSSNSSNSNSNSNGLKTMVVLGSGGHTAEMFYLLKKLDRDRFNHITYVLADSDKRSLDKITLNDKLPEQRTVKTIPRSRNVGQSYIHSIWTTFISLLYCLILVFKEKPDVILCNGPVVNMNNNNDSSTSSSTTTSSSSTKKR